MIVGVKKLTPDAVIPKYQSEGAACFDIHRTSIETMAGPISDIRSITYNTGVAFEIPKGYAMMVYSRSGHGFNNATRLANCVGVIDSDYRGELKVKLTFDGNERPLVTRPGDRIAQAMVIPIEEVQFLEKEDLTDTVRGTGGYGSTGVK